MTTVLRCTRCGSYNDTGICWIYSADYPEPSGEDHDMQPWVVESTVMTLEEVLAIEHQSDDDPWLLNPVEDDDDA